MAFIWSTGVSKEEMAGLCKQHKNEERETDRLKQELIRQTPALGAPSLPIESMNHVILQWKHETELVLDA